MFHMPESRFCAFFIHLLVSISLFSLLALFTYFILLPGFLFYSEGGFTILSLIGGVDVVLGPLITLIIYKKSKPEIKLDLAIIAAIQIAALLYGLHSLWSVRPLAVFYAQGEYYVTYEETFSSKEDQNKIDSIPALNQLKTPTIGIKLPEGAHSLTGEVFAYKMNTGNSYFINQDKYYDYEKEGLRTLSEYGITPEEAVEKNIISADSPHAQRNPSVYAFFPYRSSLKSGYALLNTQTGKFIDTAN